MERSTVPDREAVAKSILTRKSPDELAQEVGQVLDLDEIYVLCLVASGFTNEEIAAQLNISLRSMKIRLSAIFRKINVPNRFQAALWAVQNL